jgi:hypothetical protein
MADTPYQFPREANRSGILNPDNETPAMNGFFAVDTQLQALLATVFWVGEDDPRGEEQEVQPRLEDITKEIDTQFSGPWVIDTKAIMLKWRVVMQVTAVEVYLQDALTHFALYDPNLLRDRGIKKEWSYEDVYNHTEADSMLLGFCRKWAKNFVQDGGPKLWTKKLEKIGVRGYTEEDTDELEAMWGMRHMVVHNAGRMTLEFATRHPRYAEVIYNGEFAISHFSRWHLATWEFVRTTDKFIGETLRRKLGNDLIEESQELGFSQMMEIMHRRFRGSRDNE